MSTSSYQPVWGVDIENPSNPPTSNSPHPQPSGAQPPQSSYNPTWGVDIDNYPHAPTASAPSFSPNFSPAPPPPPPPGATSLPSCSSVGSALHHLSQPPVAGYSGIRSKLPDLPKAVLRTGAEAGARLISLKRRVNDLQLLRRGYWTKQGVVAAAGATSVVFTAGLGMIASAGAGMHQRNKLEGVKKAIVAAVEQINEIRTEFAGDMHVHRADSSLRIAEDVFTRGLNRELLKGEL